MSLTETIEIYTWVLRIGPRLGCATGGFFGHFIIICLLCGQTSFGLFIGRNTFHGLLSSDIDYFEIRTSEITLILNPLITVNLINIVL